MEMSHNIPTIVRPLLNVDNDTSNNKNRTFQIQVIGCFLRRKNIHLDLPALKEKLRIDKNHHIYITYNYKYIIYNLTYQTSCHLCFKVVNATNLCAAMYIALTIHFIQIISDEVVRANEIPDV